MASGHQNLTDRSDDNCSWAISLDNFFSLWSSMIPFFAGFLEDIMWRIMVSLWCQGKPQKGLGTFLLFIQKVFLFKKLNLCPKCAISNFYSMFRSLKKSWHIPKCFRNLSGMHFHILTDDNYSWAICLDIFFSHFDTT